MFQFRNLLGYFSMTQNKLASFRQWELPPSGPESVDNTSIPLCGSSNRADIKCVTKEVQPRTRTDAIDGRKPHIRRAAMQGAPTLQADLKTISPASAAE